jgi:hypothetical protein
MHGEGIVQLTDKFPLLTEENQLLLLGFAEGVKTVQADYRVPHTAHAHSTEELRYEDSSFSGGEPAPCAAPYIRLPLARQSRRGDTPTA